MFYSFPPHNIDITLHDATLTGAFLLLVARISHDDKLRCLAALPAKHYFSSLLLQALLMPLSCFCINYGRCHVMKNNWGGFPLPFPRFFGLESLLFVTSLSLESACPACMALPGYSYSVTASGYFCDLTQLLPFLWPTGLSLLCTLHLLECCCPSATHNMDALAPI